MKAYATIVNRLTDVLRFLAMLVMTSMFLFITAAAVLRQFSITFMGDIEITELLMGMLIMLGIAYAQQQNAHISIGLFVDRLPQRAQVAADVLAYVLMTAVCFMIAWANFVAGFHETRGSMLLEIPFSPFRYLVALGFLMWGLQAILSLLKVIQTGQSIASDHSEH